MRYIRGFIHLSVRDVTNTVRKAKLIEEWYRPKVRLVFAASVERRGARVQKYGIERSAIEIRVMKARWGSTLVKRQAIKYRTHEGAETWHS